MFQQEQLHRIAMAVPGLPAEMQLALAVRTGDAGVLEQLLADQPRVLPPLMVLEAVLERRAWGLLPVALRLPGLKRKTAYRRLSSAISSMVEREDPAFHEVLPLLDSIGPAFSWRRILSHMRSLRSFEFVWKLLPDAECTVELAAYGLSRLDDLSIADLRRYVPRENAAAHMAFYEHPRDAEFVHGLLIDLGNDNIPFFLGLPPATAHTLFQACRCHDHAFWDTRLTAYAAANPAANLAHLIRRSLLDF